MSVYDQIAQGVAPIGRDLPQVAGMLDARNRFQQIQAMQGEQIAYDRDRDAKQDARVEAGDAANASVAHSKEVAGIAQWALHTGEPRAVLEELPEATSELDKRGIPWQQWDDEMAGRFFQQLLVTHGPKAGIAPPEPEKPGALYKVGPEGRYATADEALGQPAFQDQDSGPSGTWSPPFQAVGADGQPALYRQHSVSGEIQPVQVGGGPALAPPKSPAQVKAETDATAKGNEKQAALKLYETARDGLLKGLESTETGPLAGRLPAVTTAQQTAAGGVAAMAPILKQLFRVAGEGVFTDRDQALLIEMVPDRTDTPGARKNKMENIDAIVRAKLGAAPVTAPEDPLGIR